MSSPRGLHRSAADAWSARRRSAVLARSWRLAPIAASLRATVDEAEADGVLDPSLLDDFEADLTAYLDAQFGTCLESDRHALGLAFGDRLLSGTDYANRLDRQLAVGASAAAHLAVEDAFGMAGSDLVRRLSLVEPALRPCYPPGAVVMGDRDPEGAS